MRLEELLATFPPEESEALTAMAVVARLLSGVAPESGSNLDRGFALILAQPPSGRPQARDLIYWYFGARAMEMMDDPRREEWDDGLRQAILATQITTGANAGSWDPDDAWGREGGRVYMTALMALCLETLSR